MASADSVHATCLPKSHPY